MKSKLITTMGIIISLILLISTFMYFTNQIVIPGLIPFSLATLMLLLIYSTYEQYKKDKIDSHSKKVTIIIALIAFITNLISGISQIWPLL